MTSFAIIALITYVKGPTKMIYLSANSMYWYIGYRGNTQRHIKRQTLRGVFATLSNTYDGA